LTVILLVQFVFLGDYKHINQNSSLHEGLSLYLAGLFSNPETVKMLNQNGVLDCSCLESTQEEADTRIILHALYSDKLYQENNGQGRIVVKSPDTDVLVLLVHYFPKMKNTSELWLPLLVCFPNNCNLTHHSDSTF
jgi:hypothetical protein